jgi:uncharacterized SAM-binding protein YcdF (DUF218 family)
MVRGSAPRRFLAGFLPVAALVALAALAVTHVGRWLVVSDPLAKADAIVVLAGNSPFRAMEAARLYDGGWAPEVWLIPGKVTAEETAFATLGIERIGEDRYNERVLTRLGVPLSAIRRLDQRTLNTMQDLQAVAAELRRRHARRCIIVTSKSHTRRVRAIWRALVSDLDARVRYSDGSYDADHWWRHTQDALEVSREVFGLLNVWTGFPVTPDR